MRTIRSWAENKFGLQQRENDDDKYSQNVLHYRVHDFYNSLDCHITLLKCNDIFGKWLKKVHCDPKVAELLNLSTTCPSLLTMSMILCHHVTECNKGQSAVHSHIKLVKYLLTFTKYSSYYLKLSRYLFEYRNLFHYNLHPIYNLMFRYNLPNS